MPVRSETALVIDALPGPGGAEKVLIEAMKLFPDAPIYTLIYNHEAFAETPLRDRQVISSYLNRLPWKHTRYRKYLPLMPSAIERFDLSRYEQIISFSYAVAHGIRVQKDQKHLSYTFTPMRYAWRNFGLDGMVRPANRVLNWLLHRFRAWDLSTIAHIDHLAAVSKWIAQCVEKAYQRQATVIYPPVEIERFSPMDQRDKYYISTSRLVAHKRLDLVVEAFNRLKLPLLIVGDGPERTRLERRAGTNIRFLGFQPDRELEVLLGRARAYVSASEEDFGIAIIEAQAAGCPVIAYQGGGALETVIEGQSGLFFDLPEASSLCASIECFESQAATFDSHLIAASVQRFNPQRFLEQFTDFAELL